MGLCLGGVPACSGVAACGRKRDPAGARPPRGLAARGRPAAAVHLRALCRPDGCNGQVDRDLARVSDRCGARRRA